MSISPIIFFCQIRICIFINTIKLNERLPKADYFYQSGIISPNLVTRTNTMAWAKNNQPRTDGRFSSLSVKISMTFGTNLGMWHVTKTQTIVMAILVSRMSRFWICSSRFAAFSMPPPIVRRRMFPRAWKRKRQCSSNKVDLGFYRSSVAFQSIASGSSPRHTIYAIINLNLNCVMLKRWTKQKKRPWLVHF